MGRRLRAALRLLDPWALTVVGGLVALSVVVLMASPGPWREVVGPSPLPRLAPACPRDAAVFATVPGGRCVGAAWVHLDPGVPRLTVVLLPARLSVDVPGAGLVPLSEAVARAGPGAAAAALGAGRGVRFDAWASLDQRAVRRVLAPLSGDARPRRGRAALREARRAWRGRGPALAVWRRQYRSLREALPRQPYADMGVVAFSNYVLGFGAVSSDLDLQEAALVGRALKELRPGAVRVTCAPVLMLRCRGEQLWRPDRAALESLRRSVAGGLRVPARPPVVRARTVPARVLVAAPLPGRLAAAYGRGVRRGLAALGGRVAVVLVADGNPARLAARVLRRLDRAPALAVLVGPRVVAREAATADAAALAGLCRALRARAQPAVVSLPLAPGGDARAAAAWREAAAVLRAAGTPASGVWRLPGAAGRPAPAGRRALRAAGDDDAVVLARVCWPRVLGPRSPAVRLGVSWLAARATAVAVAVRPGVPGAAAAAAVRALRRQGFTVTVTEVDEASAAGLPRRPCVLAAPGARRAGRLVAATLGLPLRPPRLAVPASPGGDVVVVLR